jgi:hypothetical protein
MHAQMGDHTSGVLSLLRPGVIFTLSSLPTGHHVYKLHLTETSWQFILNATNLPLVKNEFTNFSYFLKSSIDLLLPLIIRLEFII